MKFDRLLIATHNEGKRKEFEKLLAPYVGTILSAAQQNLPEPEETEDTFIGNAKLKALAGARASGILTLADDSGFGIVALGGKPGVYSARFAKTENGYDYDTAALRLSEELGHDVLGMANFSCALALARPDGAVHLVEARCEGTFTYPGRGTGGFGYDPYFIPHGHDRTFGEMTPDEKHGLSHRGKALALLTDYFASDAGQAFLTPARAA